MVDELALDCFIMYDMAHVLGLVGPHFPAALRRRGRHRHRFHPQDLFRHPARASSAPITTKTSCGIDFWEAIQRRAFPGSTSNHHLGTLLGLLMAAYEMNAFKEDYQRQVLTNAKAFAGRPPGLRSERGRRPGHLLHGDPSGDSQRGLCQGARHRPPARRKQHRRQLPGVAGRGRVHRLRCPAHGRPGNDPLRHGRRRIFRNWPS